MESPMQPYRRRRVLFFNDTATTEIYTLSLHDALPISRSRCSTPFTSGPPAALPTSPCWFRSEEHTSALQSHSDLVCRLLLEKKQKHARDPPKKKKNTTTKTDHQGSYTN